MKLNLTYILCFSLSACISKPAPYRTFECVEAIEIDTLSVERKYDVVWVHGDGPTYDFIRFIREGESIRADSAYFIRQDGMTSDLRTSRVNDTVYENSRMALIGDSVYFFFCQDSLFLGGLTGIITKRKIGSNKEITIFNEDGNRTEFYKIVGRRSPQCISRKSLRLPSNILYDRVPLNACSQGFNGWPSNATVYNPDSIMLLSDSLEAVP
jgi:hypothetical protein